MKSTDRNNSSKIYFSSEAFQYISTFTSNQIQSNCFNLDSENDYESSNYDSSTFRQLIDLSMLNSQTKDNFLLYEQFE